MRENDMHRLRSKPMLMQNVKRKMQEAVKMCPLRRPHHRNNVCTKRHPENSVVRYRTIQAIPRHGITIAMVMVTVTLAVKVKIKVLENTELP